MNKTNFTEYFPIVPSDYIYLTWDLTFRLVVLGIGIVTNIINIAVFVNPRLKDDSYKYMLTNSVTNFFYLTITFIGVLLYNCTYCPSSQTYASVVFSIGLIFYVSSCLAIFRIVVEIALSVRTYLILTNKNYERISYRQIIPILFVISMLYYGQQPFIYDIVELRGPSGQVLYGSRTNLFGNSSFAKILVIVQFSVRIFLAVVVLSTVNSLNVFEFKKLHAQRNLMESQNVPMQSSQHRIKSKNKC